MPQLLDNRLVGPNADVSNRVLYGATAGWALVVNSDGKSMVLAEKAGPTGPTGTIGPTGPAGSQSIFAETAEESYSNDSGISIQQWLCTQWYDVTPAGMFSGIADIAYGRGFFVAVGFNGNSPVIAYASVQTAQTTWIQVASNQIGFSTSTKVLGVTYSNGVFMACGSNGEIAYSSVGKEWTILRRGVDTATIYRVTYGYPHGWVAVGTADSSLSSAGVTLRSTDGLTWTKLEKSALDDDIYTSVPVYSVCSVAGRYIAVGGASGTLTNRIATSLDGNTWFVQPSPQPLAAHWRVDFGNGRLVVGTDGTAKSPPYASSMIGSNNGLAWYESSLNLNLGQVTGLAYGNGVFVCGSTSIQVSVDGINYFNAFLPSPPAGWAGSCMNGAYGNGVFVMVSSTGKMIRSAMLNEYVGSSATPPPNSGDYGGGFNTEVGSVQGTSQGVGIGGLSGGGIPGCFIGTTPILLSNGLFKPIKSLRPGDLLQGDNGYVEVMSVLSATKTYNMISFNDLPFFATSNQPFLTDRGWGAFDVNLLQQTMPATYQQVLTQNNGQPLVAIQEGMNIASWINGVVSYVPITNVKSQSQYTPVYWLDVDGNNRYIANNFVVHNEETTK